MFTVTGKLQELLLREDGLTLEKEVRICRAFEQSNKQVKEFRESRNSSSVNKVMQKPAYKVNDKKPPKINLSKRSKNVKINCKFCGYKHEKQREKCPAWGKTCDKCKDHFKSKCSKKAHAVSKLEPNCYDNQWLMAVNHKEDSIDLIQKWRRF